MDLTTLTNEQFDTNFAAALAMDSRDVEAYFAERTRRIEARQAEIATAEQAWEQEIEEAIAAKEQIKLRNLTHLQVYRLEDEAALVEGIEGGTIAGLTYFQGPRELIEALYDRVSNASAADTVNDGNSVTEAQSATAYRAALVSRESLSARLAKALGDNEGEGQHRSEVKRIQRLSNWDVVNEA